MHGEQLNPKLVWNLRVKALTRINFLKTLQIKKWFQKSFLYPSNRVIKVKRTSISEVIECRGSCELAIESQLPIVLSSCSSLSVWMFFTIFKIFPGMIKSSLSKSQS